MTASKREKIRGALLAALMVASVFAAVAPASAGVASGNRTVAASSVAPGGSTTVTVTATMDGSGGSLSLNENFSGEVAGAAVRSVTVNGSDASPIIARANENTAVITLSGLSPNAEVEVTYVVNATSSTGDITIDGTATGSGPNVDLGTDTISVESPGSGSAVTSASRSVDSTVSPGGSASVTVNAQLNSSGGGFSLNEVFSGDIDSAAVRSVTVNGSSASPVIARANENTAVVTLAGLSGNANVEVNYVVNATSTSSGSITIDGNVSSSGTFDLGTDTISIAAMSNFDVSGLSAPASATQGDSVTVSADITNTGGASGTQTVEFRAGGSVVDSTSVTLSAGASRTVSFTLDTSTLSPGTYTHGVFSDDDSETATLTVEADTGASAPGAAGSPYAPGSYSGDDTADARLAPGVTTEVTDLDFSGSSGNVDNVTVDPAAGADASDIEADDINSLEVILSTPSGPESMTKSYNGSAVDFDFGNVSDVTGVQVLAAVSDNVEDNDTVDVGIELGVGSSLFTGDTGLYDTDNTQIADVAARDSFVSAEVRDIDGNLVTNGTVNFTNIDTGRLVAEDVPLNDRGETRRVGPIAPGTYEAEVDAPGFETFSARVEVDAGETREIDVTLRPINVTDDIIVTPKSATAIAGDEDITYTVTVLDKNDNPREDVEVDAESDNSDITFVGSPPKDTDADGQTTFTVTSDVIATGTLTFTADNESGGDDPSTTATATFIRSGEGAIDGQVLDTSTTSGLPNATVYAVLESRWSQNRFGTVVDLSDLGIGDDDDTIFVRLVDADTGEIIDNDEYDIRTRDESGTGVRMVEALNESNDAVGEGFALVDIDDDGELNFSHTRLEAEEYYAQVSLDANETSDERVADDDPEDFVNVSGYDADDKNRTVTSLGGTIDEFSDFDPTAELTAEETRDRAALSGANLVDMTDEDGDFKLTDLYTEYQLGRDYVVVAQKTGYSIDVADVFVQEDGSTFEDRVTRAFNLEPEDVEPAQVNITQVGLHPVTSYDASLIAPFPDTSDDVAQEVPRNGSVVDVVEIETLDEDGTRLNGTAEVAVEDSTAFGGAWENAAIGGTVVDYTPAQDQITVNTGDDGVARLLLVPDRSPSDLVTNKTAVLTNDRSATDNTTVRFVGQINFQGAAISGIVTDSDDDPVPDSVVWAQEFVFPTDASSASTITIADQTRFTVQPDGGVAANEVDDDADEFIVTRQRWDGTNWVDVASDTVTRGELRNRTYAFPRSSFPGVSVNLTDDDGFKLLDVVELTGGTDPDASYTLDPLPAVPSDTGAASTEYRVRGVKLQDPNAGATRFGQASIQPGSTDDANIVLPINLTDADLIVQNLNAPTSVAPGQTINVSADIFNNGGSLNQEQTVEFRVDQNNDGDLTSDEVVATAEVDVDPRSTETVTFNVSSSNLSAGTTYGHGVFTEDDSQTATIDILGAAEFQINSISSPANISQGDTLNVSAEIENVGEIAGTESVSLEINGTNVSTGGGAVDIAFVIDRSASMSDEISAVRNGLTDFTNTLETQGVDVRYAIVTYGNPSPRYVVVQNYTDNLTQTQQTLNNIQANAFGAEYAFDAINGSISDLNERSGANEIFIVPTDEDSESDSNPGDASTVASQVDAAGVDLFAVTLPEGDFSITPSLSVGRAANLSADGQFFNIEEGNFSAKFENQIATAVANASAGQSITLAAGANGTVEFSIPGSTTSSLAAGNYTIEVSTSNDTSTASLTVDPGCTNLSTFVASYDSNGDCEISITELGQAGSDYAAGSISITELGQVGSAYAATA